MTHYEKPKRGTSSENEFFLVIRHFYWRLFIYLMIPALLLAFILGLPALILSNLPDRLNAQCAVFNEDVGIRIISETQNTNITTYYWSDNHGDTWHILHSIEQSYQSARADCEAVRFADNTIHINIDGELI